MDMEAEWDSATLMDEKEGFQRIWGIAPEFVWPAGGDRVWVSGRWIFDCGHPGTPDSDRNNKQYVKFSSEIHPPRALVSFRLNHPALDSFPVARVSAPNFPPPQSYLPVTGAPVDPGTLPVGVANTGPTNVPVTEADIYVSGNGGLAGDLGSIVSAPCSNFGGHTNPTIPVNDRNYVFDIYPPGTDYTSMTDGVFAVTPPVPDASLQYRVVDHFSELPAHACGGDDNSVCVTVDPIICLIDSKTGPPNQTDTSCPSLQGPPTRVRVILPFCTSTNLPCNSTANIFAKSILVGWDDVPTPTNQTKGVRTFEVRLHNLTVKDNGEGCCTDGDWRVFVNVGGQWRYMSRIFDAKSDGTSICNRADPLTENGNDDCYRFDKTPFTVSVQDGDPIHLAVGGFVARGVEDSSSSLFMCRNYPSGCATPNFSILSSPFRDFPLENDDRIGTYEFDLVSPDYAPPAPYTTAQFGCSIFSITGCSLRYQTEFTVNEIPAVSPPSSAPLVIGLPSFNGGAGIFFAPATPMILATADTNAGGFQYRFHKQGAALPVYQSDPFPVHWTHADLTQGVHSVEVKIAGANAGDGAYDFQYSAESFGNLLEPRHTSTFILDSTAPVTTFTQPQATTYAHSDILKLSYVVSDGTGSGVASFTPTMDGLTALPGVPNLQSDTSISLLTTLKLGPHTFKVASTDNVGNSGIASVTFTIIVTPASIEQDVTQFLQMGAIKNAGLANSPLSYLLSAADARARGSCSTSNNVYSSFINAVTAQRGKGITIFAADTMIADAQYLIAYCP